MLEDRKPCFPDFSKLLYSDVRSGAPDSEALIIPNWSLSNTSSQTVTIPYDGWLVVYLHAENKTRDEEAKETIGAEQTDIQFYLNNRKFAEANSTQFPEEGLMEDSDSNAILVSKGDSYHFYATRNPNIYWNRASVYLYGLKY